MDEMTHIDLDQVLAELRHADPQLARATEDALHLLTGHKSTAALTQHGLQSFLWYELPCRREGTTDGKLALAGALGQVLWRIGLARYAEVCGSATTAAVLRAYDTGVHHGLAAYRRADDRSGVRPPHLPELAWGATMGPIETIAYRSTAAALELAVSAGVLRPGARRWRATQQELAWAYLTAAQPDLGGMAWLTGVYAERLTFWLRGRGEARNHLIGAVAGQVMASAGPPPGTEAALAPLRWILAQGKHGIALTEKGNWSRAFVAEATGRFGWRRWDGRPTRSEDEIDRLRQLHRLLVQLGAVRRVGRREELTGVGRVLAEDTTALWQVLARYLGLGWGFDAHLRELAFAWLLAAPSLDAPDAVPLLRFMLAEEGWRDHAGRLDHTDASAGFWQLVRLARPLGMFDEGTWPSLRLTEPGRGLVLEALRVRAIAPRDVHL